MKIHDYPHPVKFDIIDIIKKDAYNVTLLNNGKRTAGIVGWHMCYLYDYLSDDKPEYAESIKANGIWLLDNLSHKKNFMYWPLDWIIPAFSFKGGPDSLSGICLSRGLSGLIRYHHMFCNLEKQIAGILNCYDTPMSDGGVKFVDDYGTFYEELAFPEYVTTKILNGNIIALIALYETNLYIENKDIQNMALKLFIDGVNGIKNVLHLYDKDIDTSNIAEKDRPVGLPDDYPKSPVKYSLYFSYPYKHTYDDIHVDLLNKLYLMSGEKIFREYAVKWNINDFNFNDSPGANCIKRIM